MSHEKTFSKTSLVCVHFLGYANIYRSTSQKSTAYHIRQSLRKINMERRNGKFCHTTQKSNRLGQLNVLLAPEEIVDFSCVKCRQRQLHEDVVQNVYNKARRIYWLNVLHYHFKCCLKFTVKCESEKNFFMQARDKMMNR